MKLILATNGNHELEKACDGIVEIYTGSILDVECDAIVSPANSFGFMDGGIDLLYLNTFGMKLGKLVILQAAYSGGEMPVGTAEYVAIPGDAKGRWLIIAPTMHVPQRLPHDTINPYLAARAIRRMADKYNWTVALPGLGTGVGGVSPETFARQLKAALTDFHPRTFREAQDFHCHLIGINGRDLQ